MSTHRFNHLLDVRIRVADGTDGDQVVDVRLAPTVRLRGQLTELEVRGFVVGRMRPGTLLGYDRHRDQGPWLIRTIVRLLHRHSGHVDWEEVERVDWYSGVIHLRISQLQDLS